MISNHGGRQLDGVPALDRLSSRRSEMPLVMTLELIVDGGIRRGTHIIKALALGCERLLYWSALCCMVLAAGGQGGC